MANNQEDDNFRQIQTRVEDAVGICKVSNTFQAHDSCQLKLKNAL